MDRCPTLLRYCFNHGGDSLILTPLINFAAYLEHKSGSFICIETKSLIDVAVSVYFKSGS